MLLGARKARFGLETSMNPALIPLTFVLALNAAPQTPPPTRRLPLEALALPADVHFLLDLDVARIVASPLYRAQGQQPGSIARLQAFGDVRQKLGLDPERDVRRIVVAGFAPPRTDTVALVFGSFDRPQLEKALMAAAGSEGVQVGKSTVYRLQNAKRGPAAVALLGPSCVLFGAPPVVEGMVAHEGQHTLAANHALMSLVERVEGDPAFWVAGDESLLAQLEPKKGAATGSLPLGLPPVRQLTLSGALEPQLALALTADVGDPAAARNAADMVRGFVSLLALQAQQKPALAGLAQAVTVSVEGGEVRARCHLTHEQVEALLAMGRANAPAPAAPARPAAEKPGTTAAPSPR